ncbi:hypothetical protein B0H21DRAFT_809351 [Amylocystis lapponica]|nr:hypothetical protein B0H21DRAFT_809351 [Amylocystis lapponica]
MRLALNIVGRPLNGFNMTKALTQAFCDATKGHRQAYNIGTLHCDASEGNILPVEGQPFQGILVDFDYASFRLEAMAELRDLDESNTRILTDPTLPGKLALQAEMAGSALRFMAIAFLALGNAKVVHLVQHDLESFYWVFVWIILRHTSYNHKDGPKACHDLFDHETEEDCKWAKSEWIADPDRVIVKDNVPLTLLLGALTVLVANAYKKGVALTYESVLMLFENALAMDGWPTADKAIPVQHIDASKEVPAQNMPDISLGTDVLQRTAIRRAEIVKCGRGISVERLVTLSRAGVDDPRAVDCRLEKGASTRSARLIDASYFGRFVL